MDTPCLCVFSANRRFYKGSLSMDTPCLCVFSANRCFYNGFLSMDTPCLCVFSANRCFYNGQKRLYMGTIRQTKEGMQCQAWSSQHPHEHRYTPSDFPDGRYPENYCRTTADSSNPWCYSLSYQKRWGYCNTINCGECVYVLSCGECAC